MIPKTLHYIWLGQAPLNDIQNKCIQSWKIHMNGFNIVRWDETNLDLDITSEVRKFYDEKRFGMCVDTLRMNIIYEHGGIYLDTDVMLLKPLDFLCLESVFFVKANSMRMNTGLGFGAEKNHPIILQLLTNYINNEQPQNNLCSIRETKWLKHLGYRFDSNLTEKIRDVLFISEELMNPILLYGRPIILENTLSVHYQLQGWKKPILQKLFIIESTIVNKIYWSTENKRLQKTFRFLFILPIRLVFRIIRKLT